MIHRIVDRLIAHYGEDAVLPDIDDIPPGIDFRQHLDETLHSTTILLAAVGAGWQSKGRESIYDKFDPVRIVLEGALRRHIPIIPLLIGNANMPDPDQLPASLKDFAFRDAAMINSGLDFDRQMDRLIRSMDAMLAQVANRCRGCRRAKQAGSEQGEQARGGGLDAVGGALPIATLERRRRQLRPTIAKSGFERAPMSGRASGIASQPTAPLDMVGEAAHRYRRAFLSHSHDDRVAVLTYAQLLEATGIKYFQDIASLRTMDDWERRLHEAIDQCDLFLLFWTANAAHSEWVEQETRYALTRQADSVDEIPDIMPVFLEPDAPRPPEWLKSRHFDSLLRLAMRGAAAEAKPRSG